MSDTTPQPTPTTTITPKPVAVTQRSNTPAAAKKTVYTNPGLPNWDAFSDEDKAFVTETLANCSVVSKGYIDFIINYCATMHRSVQVTADSLRVKKTGLYRIIKAMFDAPGPDFRNCVTAILKIISLEKVTSTGGAFSEPHCFYGIDNVYTDSGDRTGFKYALSAIVSLSSAESRAQDLKTVNLEKAFQCLTPTGLSNLTNYFHG